MSEHANRTTARNAVLALVDRLNRDLAVSADRPAGPSLSAEVNGLMHQAKAAVPDLPWLRFPLPATGMTRHATLVQELEKVAEILWDREPID